MNTKQTAGNNADLAQIKAKFNAQIFRDASRIYNAEGRDATIRYIGRFFNDEARDRCLDSIFGKGEGARR